MSSDARLDPAVRAAAARALVDVDDRRGDDTRRPSRPDWHREQMRQLRRPSGTFVVARQYVRLVAWSTCPRTDEPIMHAEKAELDR